MLHKYDEQNSHTVDEESRETVKMIDTETKVEKQEQHYKSLHTRLYEADYDYSVHVDLCHFPHCNESHWQIEVFDKSSNTVWKSDLDTMINALLSHKKYMEIIESVREKVN